MIMKLISVLDGDCAELAPYHAGAAFDALVVIDDERLLDNTADRVDRAEAGTFGTALAADGVDVKEKEFLIGARKVFFNDAFRPSLMFQKSHHLTGNTFSQTAACGMIDEPAQLKNELPFLQRGRFRGGRGEYMLHLACSFTAGNAFAAALVTGEFFQHIKSLECFW